MRAYLALVARKRGGRIPSHAHDAARDGAAEAIPVPHDVLRHEAWTSDDGGVALLGWSNEPEHELLPALLRTAGGRRLGCCGYLGEPDDDDPRLLRADDLGGVAETLGGVFSIFRADAAGAEAVTAVARVCPVYHAETRDLYVVGTRALLVHLAARSAETGAVRPAVDLDVLGLQPMVRHGFYTDDETPFRGVRALLAAASLTARQGTGLQVTAGPLPEAEPAPGGVRQARERVNRLAEALVAAARPLARHDRPVRLAPLGPVRGRPEDLGVGRGDPQTRASRSLEGRGTSFTRLPAREGLGPSCGC